MSAANRDQQEGHDPSSNNIRDSALPAVIETQAVVIKTQAGVIEASARMARAIDRLAETVQRVSRMLEENGRLPAHPTNQLGCTLISEILCELRKEKEVFNALKTWNPRRTQAREFLSRLFNVMLSPPYIHLFSEEWRITTAGEGSVWSAIVLAALPQLSMMEQRRWVKYFADIAAKNTSGFGEFATALVRVHNQFCEEC